MANDLDKAVVLITRALAMESERTRQAVCDVILELQARISIGPEGEVLFERACHAARMMIQPPTPAAIQQVLQILTDRVESARPSLVGTDKAVAGGVDRSPGG